MAQQQNDNYLRRVHKVFLTTLRHCHYWIYWSPPDDLSVDVRVTQAWIDWYRKLVIIGDGSCGKTSLLSVFTLGHFPTVGCYSQNSDRYQKFTDSLHTKYYVPTVFENYVTDCRVDGRSIQLALWDTAGQEDYDRLRPLAYSKAHVLLVAFSVDSPESLSSVKHKWIREVRERCPNTSFILVGLKKDLREDSLAIEEMRGKSLNFVTAEEGNKTGLQIGARSYLECSSLTGEGVDNIFEAATRATLLAFDKRECSHCVLL